jgi:hypothetical protein
MRACYPPNPEIASRFKVRLGRESARSNRHKAETPESL